MWGKTIPVINRNSIRSDHVIPSLSISVAESAVVFTVGAWPSFASKWIMKFPWEICSLCYVNAIIHLKKFVVNNQNFGQNPVKKETNFFGIPDKIVGNETYIRDN